MPAPNAVSLAAFWLALALPALVLWPAAGVGAAPSIVDVIGCAVVWLGAGAAAGAIAARRRWLAARPALAWALAAAAWVIAELAYLGYAIARPTRWPQPIGLVLLGGAGLVAAALSLVALRRASRLAADAPVALAVRPAQLVAASGLGLLALIFWAPRWLRALIEAPAAGWFATGAADLAWLALPVVAAVLLVGVVLGGGGARHRLRLVMATLALVVALGPTLVPAWTPTRPAARPGAPDLTWIVVDSLRADHTELHGYARPTSPALAALAATPGAAVLGPHVPTGRRTEATYGKLLTFAADARGFTTARPRLLGALGRVLPSPAPATLFGELERAGYQIISVNVFADLLTDKGLQPLLSEATQPRTTRLWGDGELGAQLFRALVGRRVDGWAPLDRWGSRRRAQLARQVVDAVRHALEAREAGRPVLLIVHLAGGHEPYYTFADAPRLPAVPGISPQVEAYDQALRSSDLLLGELLALRPAGPENITFVFADHGLGFDESYDLPEGSVVPLVVAPGGDLVARGLTTTLDVLATTVGIARGSAPVCTDDGGTPRLAVDLRCPSAGGRVIAQTGHGKLFLFAEAASGLVGLDVGPDGRAAMYPAAAGALTPCATPALTGTTPLASAPTDRVEGLPARLERARARCTSPTR